MMEKWRQKEQVIPEATNPAQPLLEVEPNEASQETSSLCIWRCVFHQFLQRIRKTKCQHLSSENVRGFVVSDLVVGYILL